MDIQKPLAVTMGEPAGVGAELALKIWRKRHDQNIPSFFAMDDPDHLLSIDAQLPIKLIAEPQEAIDVFDQALPIYPMKLAAKVQKGVLNAKNGKAVVDSIEMAARMALEDKIAAVVTNPIHKAALYECGFKFPGHTEFLGALCGLKEDPVMMLATQELRTVPLTVHIPLKEVPHSITRALIEQKVRIIDKAMRQDFGLEEPHIAVAGLNPHAGEDGTIGTEEQDLISQVIIDLNRAGIHVSGPYPADTMFHAEARKNYDVALCMYHDQALIPLKTLDFYGGVNVTLGLPIIRTSPDHGTALDIAGKNLANPKSLMQAIKMAASIASTRQ